MIRRRLRILVDMPKPSYDRLEITDNRASLHIAGEKRAEAALAEIDRIYLAWWSGIPLVAVDDEPFLVIVVRNEAWVLPDVTPGWEGLIFGPNFELLAAEAKFYKAWSPP